MKLKVKFDTENDLRFCFNGDNDFGLDMGSVIEIKENDHDKLINRDLPDQHPISAITGLQDILSSVPLTSDLAPVAFSGAAEDLIWPEPLILYCGTATEVI